MVELFTKAPLRLERVRERVKLRGMAHYFATLTFVSPIEVKPRSGATPLRVELHHNETTIPVQVSRSQDKRLELNPPEGVQLTVVHPRTNREGLLAVASSLAVWGEPKGDEEAGVFHAVGEVMNIDRDEAKLIVRIHPNPEGRLAKAFLLTFQTNLELLGRAPKKGAGVEVKGMLKTPSKRLVVTNLRAVPLPPVRKDAEPKKPQPQAKKPGKVKPVDT